MSHKKPRTSIRGVYSTALTRLLLDKGYEIVQPSEEIVERFSLEASESEPELVIHCRHDRQGVEVVGSAAPVEALASALRDEFCDVIIRRKAVSGCLDVEFPWASKQRLDEIRGAVTPTIKMHHFYKACGGEVSSAADMAERLLRRGRSPDEVDDLLRRTLAPHFPFEGSEVGVEHVKLGGVVLNLGKAVIEKYHEGSHLKYVREMGGGGVYDGLGTEKDAGDLAVTETEPGEYHTVTRYYSRSGRFKGAYININTPVELYPTKIRYIDLEVDICVWPEGASEVLDEEMLERFADELIITERLHEAVKAKVEELRASSEIYLKY
ncbi:MAG: DUF402 domain-containing protein [Candidatus Bathyarchaeota archaeon]|nr:DUF402 domain-containing protein [Candidatus Bathyarchaeota archaeon]